VASPQIQLGDFTALLQIKGSASNKTEEEKGRDSKGIAGKRRGRDCAVLKFLKVCSET